MGGYGNEYFGLTEMEPFNGDAINLVGFGNELPTPETAATRVIRRRHLEDGDGRFGEAYESVWVKTFAVRGGRHPGLRRVHHQRHRRPFADSVRSTPRWS